MNLKIIRSARISVKLTMIYALMFSLVLLFLNASILYGVKYYLDFQANRQVEGIKTVISNKISDQSKLSNISVKEILTDIPTKQNIFIKLVQDNDKIVNASSKFDYNVKISEPYDKLIYLENKEKHIIYENVKIESIKSGTVYFQIVKDLENEYEFIKILFIFMAIADFIGIIISIFLGYLVSKRMLKPIDNISRTAQSISINNLKERIEIKGPDDELKRLANIFNNMIERLQKAFDRQVQFVSDASHELRTPIAVIQGYANLLNRWGKDDREALEKSIYAIKLETDNMADLIERLLFLAKADSGTERIEKKKIWLNELINEVIRESRLISPNHLISCNQNDTASILADYKMLKEMLRIFIDNSIKFTPQQGKIDISSILEGKNVKIIVSDTGIGVPKDEIENIFNRFYTVDKSRSKENGGSGLGLSIAKWIVDMHQGRINVSSEVGKGTKLIVTLNIEDN